MLQMSNKCDILSASSRVGIRNKFAENFPDCAFACVSEISGLFTQDLDYSENRKPSYR